jgi:hypothetical protein
VAVEHGSPATCRPLGAARELRAVTAMSPHPKPVLLLCAISFLGCGKAPLEDEEPTASTESGLSLPGSRFEIDSDANLIVDVAGNLDWVNVADTKKNDLATGQNDDSYAGGAKEDDPCPPVGTGGIPNNKSDLKTFGVYVEPGSSAGDPGYLHVFWTRVQDPTGTTLMDFEFNQSGARCSNGVNPVRTAGDFLLEYRIEQGGATATLQLRTWTGTAWGAARDLTGAGAIGDINDSPISAANSDGLGALGPRTFGEASLDLDLIFSSRRCTSFGSAFVKSRSSDSFTSALKDFIAPTPVSISNCGRVVIRKQTDPDGLPGSFTFTHNLQTDPAQTSNTFQLSDDGIQTFSNVLVGTGYTVTESPAMGIDLKSIDCSASVGVTPVVDLAGRKLTFDIDNPLDVVDCTFTNRARGAIRIAKTRKHAALGSGLFPHSGVSFTISGGGLSSPITVTTDANGNACADNLILGDYTVTEQIPAGYVPQDTATKSASVTAGTCSTASPLSFVNLPLTNITVAVDSIVPGGTASTINCTGIPQVNTDSGGDGTATLTGVRPGTYTCTLVVDP